MQVCMHVCMSVRNVCACECTDVCMYARGYVWMHASTYVCMYACMYVCMYPVCIDAVRFTLSCVT